MFILIVSRSSTRSKGQKKLHERKETKNIYAMRFSRRFEPKKRKKHQNDLSIHILSLSIIASDRSLAAASLLQLPSPPSLPPFLGAAIAKRLADARIALFPSLDVPSARSPLFFLAGLKESLALSCNDQRFGVQTSRHAHTRRAKR